MKALLTILLMLYATVALAQDKPSLLRAAAGVNGVWYDAQFDEYPSDLELGANASASLYPHLSLVGAVYYGVNHSYTRGSLGGRATITDVDNPNLAIGVGIQYHASSENDIRPQEWAPDLTIGWKPWPQRKWILGLQSSYGQESKQLYTIVGLRLEIWEGGAR